MKSSTLKKKKGHSVLWFSNLQQQLYNYVWTKNSVTAAQMVTRLCIQGCYTESQLVSKGQFAGKVRAALLGSRLPSCWRHEQCVIHSPRGDFAHFKHLLALSHNKNAFCQLEEKELTDGRNPLKMPTGFDRGEWVASSPLWLTAMTWSKSPDTVQEEQLRGKNNKKSGREKWGRSRARANPRLAATIL